MRQAVLCGPRGGRWLVEIPQTRRERIRGLLGRHGLQEDHALLLERTRSVHTFGMRFPIVAAFLDDGFRVIRLRRLLPGRVVLPRSGVRHVLELTVGADVRPGDRLTRTSETWG